MRRELYITARLTSAVGTEDQGADEKPESPRRSSQASQPVASLCAEDRSARGGIPRCYDRVQIRTSKEAEGERTGVPSVVGGERRRDRAQILVSALLASCFDIRLTKSAFVNGIYRYM